MGGQSGPCSLGAKFPSRFYSKSPTVSGMARRIEGGWSPVSRAADPDPRRANSVLLLHPERHCPRPRPRARVGSAALSSGRVRIAGTAPTGWHEALLTSVTDVAAVFVADMLRIWPEGPFLLGGMCDGGIFALEAALQLQALGRPVALLAQFDTTRPRLFPQTPHLSRSAAPHLPADRQRPDQGRAPATPRRLAGSPRARSRGRRTPSRASLGQPRGECAARLAARTSLRGSGRVLPSGSDPRFRRRHRGVGRSGERGVARPRRGRNTLVDARSPLPSN